MDFIPWPITLLITILYVILMVFTIIKILLDTHSASKTLGYLLLVLVFPILGAIFYFSFGFNYRHKRLRKETLDRIQAIQKEYGDLIPDRTEALLRQHARTIAYFDPLVQFVHEIGQENISENVAHLLVNGEEKFPEVLRTLSEAKHFIHMEYYAWENDKRGNEIKDLLLRKIREGVKVRIMYDDFASSVIRKNIARELKRDGAEVHPVIRIKIKQLANRLNHRDHRKIIIVDGQIAFIGGINISDRYDNTIDTGLYWRDTHLKLVGPAALQVLRHWLINWNVAQHSLLTLSETLKPLPATPPPVSNGTLTQIIAGGPAYRLSNIMLTYCRVFTLAKRTLFITNPYFIPNESILDALRQAALSGVDVRLIVPRVSDSAIVGLASKYYFRYMLEAGVRIFEYDKGFIHAKSVVADGVVSVIGTANMDIRSFDLNYEISAVNYDTQLAKQLESAFLQDLQDSTEVDAEAWHQQPYHRKLLYAIARLTSAFL